MWLGEDHDTGGLIFFFHFSSSFYFKSSRFIFEIAKMLAVKRLKMSYLFSGFDRFSKGINYTVTVSGCNKMSLLYQTVRLELNSHSQLKVIFIRLLPPSVGWHLAMRGDICGCHNREGCRCWLLVGEGQGRCQPSYNAQDRSRLNELYGEKNISSAAVEKPWNNIAKTKCSAPELFVI